MPSGVSFRDTNSNAARTFSAGATALFFVSRQESPLGIVYATDAAADPGVEIAGVFPENTHPPIVYPIAVTAHSANAGAMRLLAFLASPAAKAIFEKHGFTVQ